MLPLVSTGFRFVTGYWVLGIILKRAAHRRYVPDIAAQATFKA